jgi:hypothetical protein
MDVTDGTRSCEVDLLKEAIGPPTRLTVGPVLAIDDAVGRKMRALYSRTMPATSSMSEPPERPDIQRWTSNGSAVSTRLNSSTRNWPTASLRSPNFPSEDFTAYGLTEDTTLTSGHGHLPGKATCGPAGRRT